MSATDGTASGLMEFLDWARQRGELNPTTARAIMASARAVLSVDEDWETKMIESVDVDDQLARFENLRRTAYSEASMATYHSRFRSAVAMYVAWLNKRSDWKAFGPGKKPKAKEPPERRASGSSIAKSSADSTRAIEQEPVAVASEERLISYDLPLRPGLRVRLLLPEDLTAADANRISAFVRSLAFDIPAVPKAITDGSET